ncbi:LirA/MavJ family T4SS effector [Cognataquiflexum aquatile]|uniref:LirA/MavJ family T4SS effector n=1 Tax=Cognataquiflexum aquatile TaxID=2249427 RepID=UPI0018E533EB|nr:LirA/MavJ family T4SS effector [Cognataquiflexum aquatile]
MEEEDLLQGKFETIQKQGLEEEELMQGKFETAQREEIEDEELLQGKFETAQREGMEDEELLQGKFDTAQKMSLEEEEPLQGKFETAQREGIEDEELLQGKFETVQQQINNTGLPDNLKSGIENLSGYAMDDVKVHYNSPKPASLQAHAHAQGTEIHLASGQEKHLPHEAWHVVQQKQGRVKPTLQMKGGVNVNDDAGLEKEAEVMGGRALNFKKSDEKNTFRINENTPDKAIVNNLAIQLFQDVRNKGIFRNEDNMEFKNQNHVLLRYWGIQKFLSDISRTKPYLDELNSKMLEDPKSSLSEVLRSKEPGDYQLPFQLIEGVSTEEFKKIIVMGIKFEDWVDELHGVQTHRIQWFLIESEFQDANELYRNSVNPIWEVEPKYASTMWDLIVDSNKPNDDLDFTKPEKLQNYLREIYRPQALNIIEKIRMLNPQFNNELRKNIQNERNGFQAKKQEFQNLAPNLEQDEMPNKMVTSAGSWSGWKSSLLGDKRIWKPTILNPNLISLEDQWQKSAKSL